MAGPILQPWTSRGGVRVISAVVSVIPYNSGESRTTASTDGVKVSHKYAWPSDVYDDLAGRFIRDNHALGCMNFSHLAPQLIRKGKQPCCFVLLCWLSANVTSAVRA